MPKKLSIVDLAPHIGRRAWWTITTRAGSEVKVEVVIKNVEIIYGSPCYTIEPVSGSGQARVRDSIEIINATTPNVPSA